METVDRHNMLSVLNSFPSQLEEASKLGLGMRFERIRKIAVCGMGGSAIAGEALKAYMRELPVEIIKGYEVPPYLPKETLAFAVSHSGNTEETISCYNELVKRGIPTVAICSGGKLAELSAKSAQVLLPEGAKGIMPRHATLYMLMPMLNILQNSGLIRLDDTKPISEALKDPGLHQQARQIAEGISSTPLFYASDRNSFAAKVWKISFNENAKMAAFWNEIPEMQHNEVVGLANSGPEFTAVLLKDSNDHPRVKERFRILEKLIEGRIKCITYEMKGATRLEMIVLTIYMAHLAGYYKAISMGIDPTPVEIIERLKKELETLRS
ncbi:MAG: bifunctional phosphoglucose/phosphomannose isomerase [Candidatus Anstonellales archaeon]